MVGTTDDEEELSPEEVGKLLDKLLGQVAEASKEESTDRITEKPADKLSTPERRTAVPKVGRPRRTKPS